ncbi:Uncharacterized protein OBRU01_13609 [Operophtera brumata]|uniref:Uncharacterized protein n=1 Tax=Operophtera brumata TaxID=104452 RepID=A0A0L7L846_OPEBR|nr:Uncharacterized protein OBRU01_13609 [Operophtera brumata]
MSGNLDNDRAVTTGKMYPIDLAPQKITIVKSVTNSEVKMAHLMSSQPKNSGSSQLGSHSSAASGMMRPGLAQILSPNVSSQTQMIVSGSPILQGTQIVLNVGSQLGGANNLMVNSSVRTLPPTVRVLPPLSHHNSRPVQLSSVSVSSASNVLVSKGVNVGVTSHVPRGLVAGASLALRPVTPSSVEHGARLERPGARWCTARGPASARTCQPISHTLMLSHSPQLLKHSNIWYSARRVPSRADAEPGARRYRSTTIAASAEKLPTSQARTRSATPQRARGRGGRTWQRGAGAVRGAPPPCRRPPLPAPTTSQTPPGITALHFTRPGDVRRREPRPRDIVSIASQRHVLSSADGWKVHHLTAQMDDLKVSFRHPSEASRQEVLQKTSVTIVAPRY